MIAAPGNKSADDFLNLKLVFIKIHLSNRLQPLAQQREPLLTHGIIIG